MWRFALASARARALCERALHCAALPVAHAAQVGEALAAEDILVHDFRPDVDGSCTWLDDLALAGSGPFVIAMLELPASPVLHALLQPQRRFHCGEIALLPECTPVALSQTFIAAARDADQRDMTAALASVWTVDPVLIHAARTALQMVRGSARLGPETSLWPSEAQLLQAARISRGTFVRHAHKAGFRPALRFLQAFRVLAVARSLHASRSTIDQIAARYGYASSATLRRHFRALTGLSPQQGRHLAPPELARLMHRRLAAEPSIVRTPMPRE